MMESDGIKITASPINSTNKMSLEKLSKEELLDKYKSVLVIAKKAKQAKDEFTEENRKLRERVQCYIKEKEKDENSIKAMKEMLESFTDQKLQLINEINELQKKRQNDQSQLEKLSIENESVKRQLERLSYDNDQLLLTLQSMDNRLQDANSCSNEQDQHLRLMEENTRKIQELEAKNQELLSSNNECNLALNELKNKYKSVKELYSGQKEKFNNLKDRFLEVHRKLKTLKESKKVLLETQHDYADSITHWQQEIIDASKRLFIEIQTLKEANRKLQQQHQCRIEYNNQIEIIESINCKNEQDTNNEMVVTEMSKNKHGLEKLQSNVVQSDVDGSFKDKKIEVLQNCSSELDQSYVEYQNLQTNLRVNNSNQNHYNGLCPNSVNVLNDNYSVNVSKEERRLDLENKLEKLEEDLKDSNHLISKLEDKNQKLIDELNISEKKYNNLNQQLLDMSENQEKEINALTEHMDNTKKTLEKRLKRVVEIQEDHLKVLINNMKKGITIDSLPVEIDNIYSSTKEVNGFLEYFKELCALINNLEKRLKIEENNTLNAKKQSLENFDNNLSADDKTGTTLKESTSKLDEIDGLKSQLAEMKNENQKLKLSKKQTNVLNLEIEAAEKSLIDVSNKLTARTSELKEAQELLKAHENTIKQLQEEIKKLLDNQTNQEEQTHNLNEHKYQLENNIKKLQQEKEQEIIRSSNLEGEIEIIKKDLENIRDDLKNVIQQNEEEISNQKKNNKALKEKLNEKQEILNEMEERLKNAERTIEDQQKEFIDYKTKAQAVLKKNQMRDTVREKELEEEITLLRNSEDQLKANLEVLMDKRKYIQRQYEILNENNLNLQQRNTEMAGILEDLRQQNETLSLEVQRQQHQQHDMVKQHRLQIEMINNCQKEQLEMLRDTQQKQLEQLRHEKQSLINSKMENNKSDSSLPNLDIILMEREDAEGSCEENVIGRNSCKLRKISSTSVSSSKHEFIPLDELLDTPLNSDKFQDSESVIISSTELNYDRNLDFCHQQTKLIASKETLERHEARVRHLTALLAESEQDLAKLSQMNEMLKEELRRQERSKEREQHMLNSEYMKNIILKFLTLNIGDERSRLVPVLNTILKLTRAETELLIQVAKGQKVHVDAISNTTAVTRSGWSSLLNPWSLTNNGPNK